MTTLTSISVAPSTGFIASVASRARTVSQAVWSGLEALAEYRAAYHLQGMYDGTGHLQAEAWRLMANRQERRTRQGKD